MTWFQFGGAALCAGCLATWSLSALAAGPPCSGGSGAASSRTGGGSAGRSTGGGFASGSAAGFAMQRSPGGMMTGSCPQMRAATFSQSQGQAGGQVYAPPSVDQLVMQALAADKNGDGRLSKEEVPANLLPAFGQYDADGDGLLDAAELATAAADFLAGGKLPAGKNKPAGKVAAK